MATNFPPKKNVAFTMYFFVYKNDGTIIANPTLTGSNVHVDGNTTEVTNSTLAVVDATTGLCSIALAQAVMNGDQIDGTITSSSTGAVVYTFKLMTAANTQDEIVAGTVKAVVNVGAIGNDIITAAAIAAGAIDNATFAADVGSTAYATNIMALATQKALANEAIPAGTVTALGTGAGLTTLATAAELAKVPKSDAAVSWNNTALAAINAEVDTALNTAIPGSPTADSVNERVAALDGHVTADYGATEKTCIDLLDDAAGGLADIHTDIGTAITNIGTVDTVVDGVAVEVTQVHAHVADLATELHDVHAHVASFVGSGAGATSWDYTLATAGGVPIPNAEVWVSTDLAGSNVVASGTTNNLGVVTFMLDPATYYIWARKAGWNFSNPDTEVVT